MSLYGRICSRLLVFLSLLLMPATLLAQSDHVAPGFSVPIQPRLLLPPSIGPTTTPPRTPGTFGLSQLTQAAGSIFSGTVTTIARESGSASQSIETVAITFHVDQAIRGATPGEQLTILQWIGAWSAGQRYRVGDRLLLFLYPPGKLGLTSSVGADFGRFTLDPSGRVVLSPRQLSALRADPLIGGRPRISFADFALAVQQTEEKQKEK